MNTSDIENMPTMTPEIEAHMQAYYAASRRRFAEWISRTYPDGRYDVVDAAQRWMAETMEQGGAQEHGQQVARANALWEQDAHISVRRLKKELGVSYSRAKTLHRATQPPATVQLALQLPEAPKQPQKQVQKQTQKQPRAPRVRGYVYVVKGDGIHFKIGITSNPQKRLNQLRTGSPHELSFEVLAECPDIFRMEEKLHKRFKSQCVRGEWYTLSTDDIEEIRRELL